MVVLALLHRKMKTSSLYLLALLAKTQPLQLIQEQTQRHVMGFQTQNMDMFSQRNTFNRTHHNWIIHLINLSWMNVNREKQT